MIARHSSAARARRIVFYWAEILSAPFFIGKGFSRVSAIGRSDEPAHHHANHEGADDASTGPWLIFDYVGCAAGGRVGSGAPNKVLV